MLPARGRQRGRGQGGFHHSSPIVECVLNLHVASFSQLIISPYCSNQEPLLMDDVQYNGIDNLY